MPKARPQVLRPARLLLAVCITALCSQSGCATQVNTVGDDWQAGSQAGSEALGSGGSTDTPSGGSATAGATTAVAGSSSSAAGTASSAGSGGRAMINAFGGTATSGGAAAGDQTAAGSSGTGGAGGATSDGGSKSTGGQSTTGGRASGGNSASGASGSSGSGSSAGGSSNSAGSSSSAGSTSGGNACLAKWKGDACDTCSGQTQSDKASCAQILDCYYANNCGPASCSSSGAKCGDSKIGNGTAGYPIAQAVYDCLCK